jgi:hypothetical protein
MESRQIGEKRAEIFTYESQDPCYALNWSVSLALAYIQKFTCWVDFMFALPERSAPRTVNEPLLATGEAHSDTSQGRGQPIYMLRPRAEPQRQEVPSCRGQFQRGV